MSNRLTLPPGCRDKFEQLKQILTGYGDMALAFSGGADSVFLLAAAAASGPVTAFTVVSRFFTRKERLRAVKIAGELGVAHRCLEVDILSQADVVRNDARRCYFCKYHSFSAIKAAARSRVLIHGINVDDLGDYRPGIEAAETLGFKAPLIEAGFSKREIRECSRAMGLETWDLPSQSCLATRIPVGEPVRSGQLAMVERAEDMIAELGIKQVRVRCHKDLARIEVPMAEFSIVVAAREQICSGFRAIGFSFVSLDLGGYESGKMNVQEKGEK